MTTISPRGNPRSPRVAASTSDLLAWYATHHRRLPWRLGPAERADGHLPDPYRVWISEIMLQQTTVAAVGPYFDAFTRRWPTVGDLATADEAEVMKAWAGLGYYSRARNLKASAERVAADFAGRFPADETLLLTLPGIGPYTAAAIVAIAFNRPAIVIDGNVERVVTRLYAIATPLPQAKPAIRAALERLMPVERPGEFAESLMDLGATICTPTKPACAICPWFTACAAAAEGTQDSYPVKPAKPDRPTRTGIAYVAIREDGAILLRRRPPRGLLGGMSEVPNFGWAAAKGKVVHPPEPPPLSGAWRRLNGTIEHVFTHFRLVVAVERLTVPQATPAPDGCWWSVPDTLVGEALPTLMRKIIGVAAGPASDT
ncbi:MAG: A/G-specific adenine glycosylase [Ancalomicrobiaceae bacterium]|nr:A/G-specific adenine glycosylase [Ancalomicrobiaceae bacterium]